MLQIEPHQDTPEHMLSPASHEPRWDPEKAAMRKVRVLKVPYDQDPMKEKTIFEYQGFVYICYAKKTRGRSMIRCLGIAEIDAPKKHTPFEAGKLLDNANDGLMENEKELGLAVTNFRASRKADAAGDDMGDAIKEAINDEAVQEVIKEVTGDG